MVDVRQKHEDKDQAWNEAAGQRPRAQFQTSPTAEEWSTAILTLIRKK
jgi:hypothetical protein